MALHAQYDHLGNTAEGSCQLLSKVFFLNWVSLAKNLKEQESSRIRMLFQCTAWLW